SRSPNRASSEKSSTVQSDIPNPRSSYLTTVAIAPRPSRKWRQTGLCQSWWRWLSQHETTTRGGPLPWTAYARRTPSRARQKRISWLGVAASIGMRVEGRVEASAIAAWYGEVAMRSSVMGAWTRPTGRGYGLLGTGDGLPGAGVGKPPRKSVTTRTYSSLLRSTSGARKAV